MGGWLPPSAPGAGLGPGAWKPSGPEETTVPPCACHLPRPFSGPHGTALCSVSAPWKHATRGKLPPAPRVVLRKTDQRACRQLGDQCRCACSCRTAARLIQTALDGAGTPQNTETGREPCGPASVAGWPRETFRRHLPTFCLHTADRLTTTGEEEGGRRPMMTLANGPLGIVR